MAQPISKAAGEFGARVRARRHELGKSQEQLAEDCGLHLDVRRSGGARSAQPGSAQHLEAGVRTRSRPLRASEGTTAAAVAETGENRVARRVGWESTFGAPGRGGDRRTGTDSRLTQFGDNRRRHRRAVTEQLADSRLDGIDERTAPRASQCGGRSDLTAERTVFFDTLERVDELGPRILDDVIAAHVIRRPNEHTWLVNGSTERAWPAVGRFAGVQRDMDEVSLCGRRRTPNDEGTTNSCTGCAGERAALLDAHALRSSSTSSAGTLAGEATSGSINDCEKNISSRPIRRSAAL